MQDVPDSPLSDYPDDLSECSEARRAVEPPRKAFEEAAAPMAQASQSTARSLRSARRNLERMELTQDQSESQALFQYILKLDSHISPHKLRSLEGKTSGITLPPAPPEQAKRENSAASPPSKRRTQTAPVSTRRRSARRKRAPATYVPSISSPIETLGPPSVPESLIVRLPYNLDHASHRGVESERFILESPGKRKGVIAGFSTPSPPKRACRDLSSQYSTYLPTPQKSDDSPRNSEATTSTSQASPREYFQSHKEQFNQLGVPFTPPSQRPRDLQATVSVPSTESSKSIQAIPRNTLWDAPTPPEMESPETSPIRSTDDYKLRNITLELLASCYIGLEKPYPTSQPEVWADSRTELCETLHYYRAFKAACYATGGFARAFMFAKTGHPRDYMDGSVVISRAGGGLVEDCKTKKMTLASDQPETSVVKSVRNSMEQFCPVVVIAADDNPYIPSKPPHEYCVLDYFKPTGIWWEKSQGKKFMRYRFEKLNAKKSSWWQPKGTSEVAPPGSLDPPIVQTCSICKDDHQQVYLQNWMCLRPGCAAFWKVFSPDSGLLEEPKEEELVYDPRFLKQKTMWPIDDQVFPLDSNKVQLSNYSVPGEDCSRAHWTGIVCPSCGRCNSRIAWTGWECYNSNCNFIKHTAHSLIPAVSIRDPFCPVATCYSLSRDIHAEKVGLSILFANNYRINTFTIPGINGVVTHMIANQTIVEQPRGPDAMFEELQRTDVGLRRRQLQNGQGLTQAFYANFGMPYKFVASTASTPFEGTAWPITQVRSMLNWAAKSFNWVKPRKEFNEVLALGYLEKQAIKYHDDGERGLGPTIATLSLGDTGTMRLRMKENHYFGATKGGYYEDSPPVPGCLQYEERRALQADLEKLKGSAVGTTYKQRLKAIPSELKLRGKGVKKAKEVITMRLGHGDIVIMHGADLQKYYEHSVDHDGKLRFALTCRHIELESLDVPPTYEVGADLGDYDGSKLPAPTN